ncbi:hypothetical protein K0A97_03060 [Patescibacteria group bacterium]|nr:hypothetical protein [Patescibacteria group bacterium]
MISKNNTPEIKFHSKTWTIFFFLLVILLANSFLISSQSYSRSLTGYPSYVGIKPSFGDVSFSPAFDNQGNFNRNVCEAGQDFILHISPLGCIPSVVRSDLLEEQNVPVFCPIVATQLNPLIDVETLDSISFSGQLSEEVSGVGYYPAQAALGNAGLRLNQPIMDNLGYAVIVLRKQKNESAMPDFVEGNLTARIKYDINNAFGMGHAGPFYLPIRSDSDWDNQFKQYGFWQGRGYLRADFVGENEATVSIYSKRDPYDPLGANERIISTVSLDSSQGGRTSTDIFMPGFDYCMGSLNLRLDGIEKPDTTVRLNVNGDYQEFKKNDQFLDSCKVLNIEKKGIVEEVRIRCKDDIRGWGTFTLSISPMVELEIGGAGKRNYSVGDVVLNSEGLPLQVTTNPQRDENGTVYVAYLRTKGNTKKESDLEVVLVTIPTNMELGDRKLTESQLKSFAKLLDKEKDINQIPNPNLANLFKFLPLDALLGYKFQGISQGNTASIFGVEISLLGFSGPKNKDLSTVDGSKDNYTKAIEDYDYISEHYLIEKYPDERESQTIAQKALTNQISLSERTNQMRDVLFLCEDFKEKYPDFDPPEICMRSDRLASFSFNSQSLEINGRSYLISLDAIKQPSFDDFGARIMILDSNNRSKDISYDFIKNEAISIGDLGGYIQLLDVNKDSSGEESVRIKTNLREEKKDQGDYLGSEVTITLNKGMPNFRAGGDYVFVLDTTNLREVAKVSVISNIKEAGTEATFPFKIGIEKRGIQLSPEKTKDRIEKLNSTINTWRNVNDKLGTLVSAGKAACLVTGTSLLIKNFISNVGGTGIARQFVMRGPGGWIEECERLIRTNEFSGSLDSCLLHYSDEIDQAVSETSNKITEINDFFSNIQDCQPQETSFFGESRVKTDLCLKNYLNQKRSEIINNLEAGGVTQVRIGSENFDVSNLVNNMTSENILLEDVRDLELYSKLLNSDVERVPQIANISLTNSLGNFWANSKLSVEMNLFAEKYGADNAVSLFSSESLEEVYVTEVKTFSQLNSLHSQAIETSETVYLVKDESSNRDYLLVLGDVIDGRYPIKETYNISPGGMLQKMESVNPLHLSLIKSDSSSLRNRCTNCIIRFYESGAYEGFPAIVPFDIPNGWYAAVKPAIPGPGITGGNLEPFDDSGKVSNFYLCNVGPDKEEDFFRKIDSGAGDDICRLVNLGTGQPYDQFPGLSPSEASRKITQAQQAFREASAAYNQNLKGRKIAVLGQLVEVGDSAIGVPDIQCQDFMSPKDCNILFNVCDPVICPNSRCNLGGKYTVDNVIQSGIIGSVALCLPNWPDIKVPICVSGVHAGVDGLLTVFEEYRDCLQISLDTGEQVGICDALHSVYLCEFFWRQTLPVVQYGMPQIISSILGKNVRGGGEYLGLQNAFSQASGSAEYFTQFYAIESFKAFKARSMEGVGTEFCRNFISVPGLGDGKIFDALLAPDSPHQSLGWFQEIPYTTLTVPVRSQYKVFFHIYAGQDLPASYEVYLKGSYTTLPPGVSERYIVDRGYLETGGRVQETSDFLAPAGYNQMCITVNNQEECGFKQISTDFGIQYISSEFASSEASRTDITTENVCISGSPNIRSLLNLNVQAGAEEFIDPEIYDRGIIRICSTDNPGLSTDPYANTEKSRWKSVGYCDNPSIKCWLDTQSVENTIDFVDLENKTLSEVTPYWMNILTEQMNLIEDFSGFVSEIETLKTAKEYSQIINKINENYDRVFFSKEKAFLRLLRGDAFGEITLNLIQEENNLLLDETTSSALGISSTQMMGEEEADLIGFLNEYIHQKETISPSESASFKRITLLKTMLRLRGEVFDNPNSYCFHSILNIYTNAGFNFECFYAVPSGTKYSFLNNDGTSTVVEPSPIIGSNFQTSPQRSCTLTKERDIRLSYDELLTQLQVGDWVDIIYRPGSGGSHAVIFVRWVDTSWRNDVNKMAWIYHWGLDGTRRYRFEKISLAQTKHAVYMIRRPV